MTNFNTSKESSGKVQIPTQPSRSSQIEIKKLEKSESDYVQTIKDESFKTKPNFAKVDSSANLIVSLDLLRDLQGINAHPKIIEIIEKRIEVLSTLQRK